MFPLIVFFCFSLPKVFARIIESKDSQLFSFCLLMAAIFRETKSAKRCLDNDYDHQNVYPTPESTKRRKISSDEDDQTPPSRQLPTNHTLDVPDSTTSFTDSYENPFQAHFYDPNLYTSPYSRFPPTHPFAYPPMASTPTSNPFSFAAAAAAASCYSSPYSFSSPYYQYPTSS